MGPDLLVLLAALLAPPGEPARALTAPAGSQEGSQDGTRPRFHSGPPQLQLAVPDKDASTLFALALAEARAGRTAAARKGIDEALAVVTDEALRARVEREKERLDRWGALRDAYLAAIAGTKEKLSIVLGGEPAKVDVLRVDAGWVYIGKNQANLQRVSVEELPVGPLAVQMRKKGAELAEPWVRVWGLVLGGETKWKTLLKGEDEGSRSLRADAEDYAARLALADTVLELDALAALPPTDDPAQAELALGRLKRLKQERGSDPLVLGRKEALRAYAVALNAVLFRALGPAGLLHAKYEEQGGLVHLAYPFDDPAELTDFEAADYMREHHERFPRLQGQPSGGFSVKKGVLSGIGAACIRLPIQVGAPALVRYDMTFAEPPAGEEGERYLMAALGDDGQKSFAWVINAGHLEVWTAGGSKQSLLSQDPGLDVGRTYKMEIRTDGRTVEAWRDGQKVMNMPFEREKGGMAFLWLHSDHPVSIGQLEIEGTLDPTSLDRMRDAWVERQLEGF